MLLCVFSEYHYLYLYYLHYDHMILPIQLIIILISELNMHELQTTCVKMFGILNKCFMFKIVSAYTSLEKKTRLEHSCQRVSRRA